jgi:hypothetical protein
MIYVHSMPFKLSHWPEERILNIVRLGPNLVFLRYNDLPFPQLSRCRIEFWPAYHLVRLLSRFG